MKVDIGGAFLCAKIDEHEEVFLQLDRKMTELAVGYMPELEDWVRREDQTIFVRVDKAMYGLIQSPKLWYKELTQCLMSHGFKICKSDECILHKKTQDGKDIIQRYARPRSANMYCSLNGGIRQGLIERSIGAPDQRWFYERAMGSTCGVHEVTYGQFTN
jgi:hypothetical protein